MRIRREIFRYRNNFVAVRPIKMSSDKTIKPGEKIDKKMFRRYHLRSLYKRRRIGVAKSNWTLAMLEGLNNPRLTPERGIKDKVVENVVENPKNSGNVVENITTDSEGEQSTIKPWEQ